MITILAVGEDAAQLAAFGAGHPSVEIVASTGAEDALDRLARNRRIDAVLILEDAAAPEIAALILEEDPGAPPLYVLAGCRSEPSGTTRLSAFNGPDAADELLRALSRP
jgi:hypothetical protein